MKPGKSGRMKHPSVSMSGVLMPQRFPRPRLDGTDEYAACVQSWLVSACFREMNASGRSSDWDFDALVDYLEVHATTHGSRYIACAYDGPANRKAMVVDLAGQVRAAVVFCLREWLPKEERIRRWAVAAGRKGKRPKEYTVDMLAPYDGLTARQQAVKLGCSVRTIWTLRKELKARAAAPEKPSTPAPKRQANGRVRLFSKTGVADLVTTTANRFRRFVPQARRDEFPAVRPMTAAERATQDLMFALLDPDPPARRDAILVGGAS